MLRAKQVQDGGGRVAYWWCKSASARFTEVVKRISFRQGVWI